MAYSDGEVRQQFSICFRALPTHVGDLKPSPESPNVRWASRNELTALDIHPSMRLRIDHGYANLPGPYIG